VSVDLGALIDAAVSHALATGLFETVNAHEPKSAPGYGLSAAVWVQKVTPVQSSGLQSSSARVELSVRLFTNMLTEPQDMIDPNMIDAVNTLFTSYAGDFDLGVAGVRHVDLLGAVGLPLEAQAGYVNQDGKLYRVMTITLPIVVNDVWDEVA
jgi:hypothetical protein